MTILKSFSALFILACLSGLCGLGVKGDPAPLIQNCTHSEDICGFSPTEIDPFDPIIDNGQYIQLGIGVAGDLNVPGGTPSWQSFTSVVGLRFLPTGGESTAPGCTCEGWGAGNRDGATGAFSGYANSAVDGRQNMVIDFASETTTVGGALKPESVGTGFKAVVKIANRLKVTHDYHPSANPYLYEVAVTLENIGVTPIGDAVYRRVMDWDIPPTTFSEWVEIHVGTASNLIRASSDGFLSGNPLNPSGPFAGAPPTTLVSGSPDYFRGPADQGTHFDFTFGALAPGESRTFYTYYGAAGNRDDILAALSSQGVEMYSLGFPTSGGHAAVNGPNVFGYGFKAVGGTVIPNPLASLSLAPAAQTLQLGQTATLTATLSTSTVAGQTVSLVSNSGPDAVALNGVTDNTGSVSFSYSNPSTVGVDVLHAEYVDASHANAVVSSGTAQVTWVRAQCTVVYTGGTTSDYTDSVAASAVLTRIFDAAPLSESSDLGLGLDFELQSGPSGSVSLCSNVGTGVDGSAYCSALALAIPGTYNLVVSFPGSATVEPCSTSVSFLVTPEETTIDFSSQTQVLFEQGQPAVLSARLLRDGLVPIAGRSLDLSLGSLSCSGLTGGDGIAYCTLTSLSIPTGPTFLTASFAGDVYYDPAGPISKEVLVYANVPGGAFSIGNLNSDVGSHVYFWGAQWSQHNALSSGGFAPNQYKGFTRPAKGYESSYPSTAVCASNGFRTSPGNSASPPAGQLPSHIAVIVTSQVTTSPPNLNGSIVKIVIVQTDFPSSYAANPGGIGTGTVVAVKSIC